MNRPHFQIKRKKKEHPIDRVQSRFVKFTVTITSCILICSVAFTFLLFKTDTLVDVDSKTLNKFVSEQRVKVASITQALNSQGTNVNIPGVSFTAGEWYQPIPQDMRTAVPKAKEYRTRTGKLFPLYEGLPWDADDNTYRYDMVQAAKDMVEFIDTKAGKPSNLNPQSTIAREHPSSRHNYRFTYEGIDVIAFAPPPCVYMKDYCDAYTKDYWMNAQSTPGDIVGYHPQSCNYWGRVLSWNPPRKYCVELIEKSTNKTYYMPLCVSDVKGHTFPGGVMQTQVKLADAMSSPDQSFRLWLGDTGRSQTFTWTSFVDSLDTLTNVGVPADLPLRAFFQLNLELDGIDVEDQYDLTTDYEVTAYIAW